MRSPVGPILFFTRSREYRFKGLGHARSKQADFRAEGHATGCSAAIMPAILRLANSSNANAPRGGAAQHNVLSGSATGRSLCLSF